MCFNGGSVATGKSEIKEYDMLVFLHLGVARL